MARRSVERWLAWFPWYRRRSREAELERELRDHLDLEAEEQRAAGLSAPEAARTAHLALGNTLRIEEDVRAAWGFRWLEILLQDVRYGVRQLRRNPGFATVVVLTLALGIGANTAIFSLMDAVMLRTLPVKDPGRLVLLNWVSQQDPAMMDNQSGYETSDATGRERSTSFGYPAFEDLHAHAEALSGLFGFVSLGTAEVSVRGHVDLAEGELISGGYFSTLGVSPVLGRPITAEDERPGVAHAAVISYGYWSREFGRDRAVIGRHIAINSVPFTIVGIAPPEFFGVQPGRNVDVWVPFVRSPKLLPYGLDSTPGNRSPFTSRDWWWLMVMGRLEPKVDARQATAQLDTLFQQSVLAGIKTPPKPQFIPHIELESASRGLSMLREQFSQPLWILMIAVAVVLLIACANVASLLLARSATRDKEVSLRVSLGAGRWRIVRQMLTETVVLAAIGGTLGLVFAYWGSRGLLLLISPGGNALPLSSDLDLRVLAFAAAVSVLTGILFGLAPALRSTRVDLIPMLKEASGAGSSTSGSTSLRQGRFLVVGQVALTMVLLIGAGLFIRTLENLEHQDLGFNANHLLLFAMDPTTHGYEGQRLADLYGRLLSRFQTLPGVRAASTSEIALISGGTTHLEISIEGYKPQSGQDMSVDFNKVGPSFFETMGIPVHVGREIEWSDTATSPKVAVVNEAFVDRFFPSRTAIGQQFTFHDNAIAAKQQEPYEIVGVSGDAKYGSVRNVILPTVYIPWAQLPYSLDGMHFELRTAGDPLAMVPSVRRVVHDTDPTLPVAEFKTETEQIGETLLQQRLFAQLSSFFAGLAALLACIGLYGLIAYSVARRTHEVGVRMALGAQRKDVLRKVIGEGMLLTAIGIAIGIGAALGLTGFLQSMLFDVKPADPGTFAAVAVILTGAALAACYIPARRAANVDPMEALRYE